MRRDRAIAVLILLLGLTASGVAWARGNGHHGFHSHPHGHHHGRFHDRASAGVVIGVPLYGYRPYPDTPAYGYSYPPVVAAPYPPPVYIERGTDQTDGTAWQGAGYWYYCANPQGYYPYVAYCPAGWQLVPAYPPR
jgi:hypothetical protein